MLIPGIAIMSGIGFAFPLVFSGSIGIVVDMPREYIVGLWLALARILPLMPED